MLIEEFNEESLREAFEKVNKYFGWRGSVGVSYICLVVCVFGGV